MILLEKDLETIYIGTFNNVIILKDSTIVIVSKEEELVRLMIFGFIT